MIKLYKAILLVKNQNNYTHVRFCNDLESRRYRLNRDGYNIVSFYEHNECVDKATLCEQFLQSGQSLTDEEYNTIVRTKDKHESLLKKFDRDNNLKGTTVQDVISALGV